MDITLTRRTLHFKQPARTSRGAYTEHDMLLVTITGDVETTDAEGHLVRRGGLGVGECAPLPDLSCDRHAYDDYETTGRLLEEALQSDDYSEHLRDYPALLFALESAMFEYQQNPVLYQTPFARGEHGIPINGLVWMADYEGMLQQVKTKLKAGFRCIKLKIGAIDWESELRLLTLIRSRFSPETLELRVDANGGLVAPPNPPRGENGRQATNDALYDSAMQRLEQLAKLHIHSIEQPIPARWQTMGHLASPPSGGWGGLGRLCASTPLPIALDEELIGLNRHEERRAMLDEVRPQYVVIKPTLHGGITGALEWASLAKARGIGSWVTSALESNIGLRHVALLSAAIYGPKNPFPQGLGTGQLFLDNIPSDLRLEGPRLWLGPSHN